MTEIKALGNDLMNSVNYPTILLEVNHGGSPSGLSYYKNFYNGCPRKAIWDKEYCDSLSPEELKAYYGSFVSGSGAAVIGTMGHLLFENYFQGNFEDVEKTNFVWLHDFNEKAFEEAKRCFKAWIDFYGGRYGLGSPLYVEEDLALKEVDKGKSFGLWPLTGRLDLATKLDLDDVKRFREVYGEEILIDPRGGLKPGKWIDDHKFFGQELGSRVAEALESFQFWFYCMLWNLSCAPEDRVEGVIQNTIYTTKVPKFRLYVVPWEEFGDMANRARAFVETILRRMGDGEVVNVGACFNWSRECRWRLEGRCKGY